MALLKRLLRSLKKILQPLKPTVKRKKVSKKSKPAPKAKIRKPSRKFQRSSVTKSIKFKKKPAKSAPIIRKKADLGVLIGEITHYFSKISVVVLKTTHGPIKVGDEIQIRGSTRFIQKVASLQIENEDVTSAGKGKLVGLKTLRPAKPGDRVYRL